MMLSGDHLRNMGLTRYSYPAGSDWKDVDGSTLSYEVIIIDEAYSGLVWNDLAAKNVHVVKLLFSRFTYFKQ